MTDAAGAPRARRRRVVAWVLGLVLLAATVGGVFWFWWLPNWRPPLADGERYGIDVSAHQGEVDWRRVARDDIAFAYMKATEGRDFTDRYFERNWAGAGEAGLDRGAYHFFTLCSPGLEQARHFLRVASPADGAGLLAPALDLELGGNCSRRPAAAVVQAEVDVFLAEVERAWSRPVVLYVGDDWEGEYPIRARREGRPLWHRRFVRKPNVDGWTIWQFQWYAKVDGVPGQVDLNVMRSTEIA